MRKKAGGSAAGTLMGFLRSTMKPSARCIRNRVNLWHRIRSISSACLILMLTRIEFTEGSMSTRSFSFRDIVIGFRSTSLDPLRGRSERVGLKPCNIYALTRPRPLVCCDARRPREKERDRVLPPRGPISLYIPEMGSFPASVRRSELI